MTISQKLRCLVLVSMLAPAFPPADDSSEPASGIRDENLALLGFHIGKASLGDIRMQLGGTPREIGDGANWRKELCYLVSSPARKAIVFFRSNSMANRADGLTSVGVSSLAAFHGSKRCTRLNIGPGQPATAGGLRLGLSEAEVKELVGPGKLQGSRLEVVRLEKRPMTAEEQQRIASDADAGAEPTWDVTTSFVGSFRSGRLATFEVGQVVSY